jgi:hypothetical protein
MTRSPFAQGEELLVLSDSRYVSEFFDQPLTTEFLVG